MLWRILKMSIPSWTICKLNCARKLNLSMSNWGVVKILHGCSLFRRWFRFVPHYFSTCCFINYWPGSPRPDVTYPRKSNRVWGGGSEYHERHPSSRHCEEEFDLEYDGASETSDARWVCRFLCSHVWVVKSVSVVNALAQLEDKRKSILKQHRRYL